MDKDEEYILTIENWEWYVSKITDQYLILYYTKYIRYINDIVLF